MFSVMNSIRNSLPKTEEAVLNILVIQDDHSEYVYDLCTIPNVNVISYFNNIETQTGNEHEALSVFQVRKYPENLTVINDLDNVLFSHFEILRSVITSAPTLSSAAEEQLGSPRPRPAHTPRG